MLLLLRINAVTLRSLTLQNTTLLVASYIFYAAWDWRFLSLLIISTLVDFVAGRKIAISANQKTKRRWLWLSITTNLSMLGFFKYFNFFSAEFQQLLQALGIQANWNTLYIILPIGLSFFTFQTMTYTIDVYRDRIKHETNILRYATYVAFFPQLIAGPIERAKNLLPQFHRIGQFSWVRLYQGISLIIFGLFLKIVIADSLAPMTNQIFKTIPERNGGELVLGAIYFACQIYGDFCGYSTIAVGVATIMGFHLMTNFNTPYLSTSLQDFWRNWHISLSTFFRDYVYIPLGGSRNGTIYTHRNLLITFTLSGLWHGANWTFIIWGALHGFGLILTNQLRKISSFRLRWITPLAGWAVTMLVVLIGWIVFRSPNIHSAADYLIQTITTPAAPQKFYGGLYYVLLVPMIDLLWFRNVRLEGGLNTLITNIILKRTIEALVIASMFMSLLFFSIWNGGNNEFIYFQF